MLSRRLQKYWDMSGYTKLQIHDKINVGEMPSVISLAVNGFSKKLDCQIDDLRFDRMGLCI